MLSLSYRHQHFWNSPPQLNWRICSFRFFSYQTITPVI
jgi:hypothetical protein